VQDGYLDLSDVATILVPEAEAKSCLLAAGDVLMNEGGDADKLGRGCIWAGEIAPCLHQNHIFAVRPRLVRSEWLNAWTSTEVAKAFFESRAKQSTNLASISATNIKELPIPAPPVDEQRAIVAHIAAETAKLDALRAATERTIVLLKERRAALIAAAVTGKLDMQGAGRHIAVVAD
jgi:type I restriction enzyme S subunit